MNTIIHASNTRGTMSKILFLSLFLLTTLAQSIALADCLTTDEWAPKVQRIADYGAVNQRSFPRRPYNTKRLIFGTNRSVLLEAVHADFPDLESLFSDTPSGSLVLGYIDVNIPKTHQRGAIESPGELMGYQYQERNPAVHFAPMEFSPIDPVGGITCIVAGMIENGSAVHSDAVVYVHGIRNRWLDPAYATAQLLHDTEYNGIGMFFSWPADPNGQLPLNYGEHVTASGHSFEAFDNFVSAVLRETQSMIAYVSHSHGTSMLVHGLDRLIADSKLRSTDDRLMLAIWAHGDIPMEYLEVQYKELVEHLSDRLLIINATTDLAFETKRLTGAKPTLGQANKAPPGSCLLMLFSSSHTAFSELDVSLSRIQRALHHARNGGLTPLFDETCKNGLAQLGFPDPDSYPTLTPGP